MGETYYDVLGIPADATQAEITEAYRERVMETHPDRNDASDAAEQFKRVTEAEEVLSDEDERARYDRLGHEAYVRWGGRFPDDGADPNVNAASGRSAGSRSRSDGAGGRSRGRSRHDSTDASTGSDRSGPSHHAKQRYRRQWQTAAETDWWFGDNSTGAGVGGSHAKRARRRRANEHTGYAVHGWDDDDVDLDESYGAIDQRTAIVVACVAAIYPLLVYMAVSPLLPIPLNVVVAGCTLVFVGYLLTMPRIALSAFGFWSLVVPPLLPHLSSIELASAPGVLVVSAFWIPFVYAVAVWWVMQT